MNLEDELLEMLILKPQEDYEYLSPYPTDDLLYAIAEYYDTDSYNVQNKIQNLLR